MSSTIPNVKDYTAEKELLHVHDLPQLYTRPSAQILISTLHSLVLTPPTFSNSSAKPLDISSSGLAGYLTQIVSSSLFWLEEGLREEVWDLASTRLAERSGRSAAPAMTRDFWISETLFITLHEPSLTGDMLGLKTWSSSLMLARKLGEFKHMLPSTEPGTELRVLELGSGTGLVGLAAACTWSDRTRTTHVTLSDLPEIVPNLKKNVENNWQIVETCHGRTKVCTLDWADGQNMSLDEDNRFPVIVAADPLYSPEHPKLLVNTVGRWLARTESQIFVAAVPLRDGYESERREMRDRLQGLGLEVVNEGEESGFDDWERSDGERLEVKYAWSIWKGGSNWCHLRPADDSRGNVAVRRT